VRIVVGNKIEKINKQKFEEITSKYPRIEIDLGAGDGRFAYKSAVSKKDTLFIGIDSAEKQLEIYSKKTVKERLRQSPIQSILIFRGEVSLKTLSNQQRAVLTNFWGC
jgi:tRNA G46 methylase TrmB